MRDDRYSDMSLNERFDLAAKVAVRGYIGSILTRGLLVVGLLFVAWAVTLGPGWAGLPRPLVIVVVIGWVALSTVSEMALAKARRINGDNMPLTAATHRLHWMRHTAGGAVVVAAALLVFLVVIPQITGNPIV